MGDSWPDPTGPYCIVTVCIGAESLPRRLHVSKWFTVGDRVWFGAWEFGGSAVDRGFGSGTVCQFYFGGWSCKNGGSASDRLHDDPLGMGHFRC